jgi:hypothetical protein
MVIYEAVAEQANVAFAISCAVAFASSHFAAIQGGDLQNDCLLSAVFVGAISWRQAGILPTYVLAGLTLIKPSGWVYAAIAVATSFPKRLRFYSLITAVMTCWWLRNFILSHRTSQSLPSANTASLFATSIASHGIYGLETLARSAQNDGFTTALFLATALGAVLFAQEFNVCPSCVS